MFARDHSPPHLHAEYAGQEALFDLRSFAVLRGKLAPRATGFVVEWMNLHQAELLLDWEKLQNGQSPDSIKPLE